MNFDFFFVFLYINSETMEKIGSAFKKKPWHIPKEMLRLFGTKKIDEVLGLFNRACEGNFYMADYFNQKMFVGDSSHSTFSGYSRALVEKEGFDFYLRILKQEEFDWMVKMNNEASRVLYDHPESQRKNLKFSYDLIITNVSGREMVLRYKLIPFQFDKNGNLWLGLIFCTQQRSLSLGPKAIIDNFETGERYEFINDEFVLSKIKHLTADEIAILKWIANGMSGKNMCELLKISERSLRRKEQSAFAKLDVNTPSAAVYKAATLGII